MGHFFPTKGEVGNIFPRQPYQCVSYEMSHEANHIYFSCFVPVRIVLCLATCCCNDRFNKNPFCYGIFILVIDPMDSAVLETINVNKLHGKSIIRICDLIKYEMRWDTMPAATWHTLSSFKIGRHTQLWLSTLHLMHSWAQLHRQSLLGICTSKSGSCWMNLSSCWPTAVWLQFLLCPYQLIVDCCNLFSCNWAVVLCVCWHVPFIMAIRVIMIVKVALVFGSIQWHNNIDCCVRCHVGCLLLCDKDNANQRLHKACTGDPLHVPTSVVWGTWCHCCFSSSPRLTFGTKVDCCDDFGHKRGCHLVALWAFKIDSNLCWHDLSH